MNYKISTPAESSQLVAELFERAQNMLCKLEVLEERCFSGQYLPLGSMALFPDPDGTVRDPLGALLDAVRGGAFEWKVPRFNQVQGDLIRLLGIETPKPSNKRDVAAYERALGRISRAVDSMGHIAVRLGLIHPRFDAGCFEDLPFRRATTIVADTSGILQGALHFVARFLHPTARIKIPAIVHMEIVNQADRFLSMRRSKTAERSASALLAHLISQGGQRALLRLELQPDTEIERSAIFGDPLRNAFRRDTNEEFNDLNLSVPLRSYCDRLVLETARQHQAYANPGHPVMVLTGDQGLARMALAEGIKPLYFGGIGPEEFFGETFAGVAFHPFTGQLYHISLTEILWELATAFGCARIITADGSHALEVAAIGQDIVWAPFHSHGDLLGTRRIFPTTLPVAEPQIGESASGSDNRIVAATRRAVSDEPAAKQGFYKFNVSTLLGLITHFDSDPKLANRQIQSIIGTLNTAQVGEYRKFLESGEMISVEDDTWIAREPIYELMTAIRTKDFASIERTFRRTPSFRTFLDTLAAKKSFSRDDDLPFSKRALPTYQTLAEISCAGTPIAAEGFFATPNNPPPTEFAIAAVRRYDELAGGQPLVPVGAWLESLVRSDGVHPLHARDRLDEATAMGMLKLVTEGSTLDTHHDSHAFRMIDIERGRPVLKVIHLYRGDFLIPGKASASLRLEGTVA
jgi:hypothetical protein